MGYCGWAEASGADKLYHDTEWGLPLHDDRMQFEYLSLEALQCGLSWSLMLKKREIFRQCFENFDYEKVAEYGEADIKRILGTEGMIRSERKIRAIIQNAVGFRKIREEYGSFSDYIWSFSGGKTILYEGHGDGPVPVSNALSEEISRDLKKRGFLYLGAITVYAHLQAAGIINDHDTDCPCREKIISAWPCVRMERRGEKF